MTSNETPSVTTQVHRIYIRATAQAVWDAITQPEWSDRYGYGGRVEYDLRPGGIYRAHSSAAMRAAGAPDLAIDGEVVEADPPRRLVQTWRMVMDERMAAEGFTRLTYEIEERPGGMTRLTMIHELSGAPTLALLLSGGMEDQGAGGGWSWVLSSLKSLLETGEGLAFVPGAAPPSAG
ncbi:MAG: SRPBCC family protein [Candidatus Dormibacteria bacterium]